MCFCDKDCSAFFGDTADDGMEEVYLKESTVIIVQFYSQQLKLHLKLQKQHQQSQ